MVESLFGMCSFISHVRSAREFTQSHSDEHKKYQNGVSEGLRRCSGGRRGVKDGVRTC